MDSFKFQVNDEGFQLQCWGVFFHSQNPAPDKPAGFSLSAELPWAGRLSLRFCDLQGWDFEHLPASVMPMFVRGDVSFEEYCQIVGAVPFTQERADELDELLRGVEVDLNEPLEVEEL